MVHACNPSTQELEAGGQPGLHSETLTQKKRQSLTNNSKTLINYVTNNCFWINN
jgi:hypothetical protein